MPKAEEGPPEYPFSYVVEFIPQQRLDPHVQKTLFSYGEPRRFTRAVLLGGKLHALAFVQQSATKGRALRLHWRDRSREFFREWKQDDGGAWHRIELPPPITIPAAQARNNGLPSEEDELISHALTLAVKELRALLTTGRLDPHLQELMRREQSAENRSGAVSALAARYGVVSTTVVGA